MSGFYPSAQFSLLRCAVCINSHRTCAPLALAPPPPVNAHGLANSTPFISNPEPLSPEHPLPRTRPRPLCDFVRRLWVFILCLPAQWPSLGAFVGVLAPVSVPGSRDTEHLCWEGIGMSATLCDWLTDFRAHSCTL